MVCQMCSMHIVVLTTILKSILHEEQELSIGPAGGENRPPAWRLTSSERASCYRWVCSKTCCGIGTEPSWLLLISSVSSVSSRSFFTIRYVVMVSEAAIMATRMSKTPIAIFRITSPFLRGRAPVSPQHQPHPCQTYGDSIVPYIF